MVLDDPRNLIGLEGVPPEELRRILDHARLLRDEHRGDELSGRIVANLFFEDSTRTRCSFETAGARLGAHVLNLSAKGSSASKGESLVDTALNIEAMGVDAIVVRTSASGGAALVAGACSTPVINAGDGRHEHPTQALLDLLVLEDRLGALEGRTVAIVGDIMNSRVARSNVHGLTAMGARVVLVGPPSLVDDSFCGLLPAAVGQVEVSHDLDAVIDVADALMMLRIQRERSSGGVISSDYRTLYGMTTARAAGLRDDQVVLHPGPVNRGVELDGAVLDHASQSVVLDQVSAGVWIRAAVLARAMPA